MIELKNISKSFLTEQNLINVLDDISIIFPEKGFVCIVGKSGSGKSTLLNIIGSLEKPDSGEIMVNGASISVEDVSFWNHYRAHYMGFIFQEYNLLEELTVEDNISLSLEILNHNPESIRRDVNEALESVDLQGYNDRKVNKLSGGEKQRVSIARSIVKDTKIILADEPTGNLDESTSIKILDYLKKISEKRLVVMVTHDLDYASKYADMVLTLSKGKIQSESTIDFGKPKSETKEILIIDEISFPMKSVHKLAKENLEYKRKRINVLILSLVMSFVLIYLALSFFTFNYGKVSEETFLKNDIHEINFQYISQDDSSYSNVYADYQSLSSSYSYISIGFINYKDIYLSHLSDNYNNLEEEDTQNWYMQNINGFVVSDNFEYELLFGDAPADENDILITDYLAKMLLLYNVYDFTDINDLVDETITYTDEYNNHEFTISGIIKTGYEDYLSFDELSGDYYVAQKEIRKFRSVAEDNYLFLYLSQESWAQYVEDSMVTPIVFTTSDNSKYFYYIIDSKLLDGNTLIGDVPELNTEVVVTLSQMIKDTGIDETIYMNNQSYYNDLWIGSSYQLESVSSIDYEIQDMYTIVGLMDDVNNSVNESIYNGLYVTSAEYLGFYNTYNDHQEKGLKIRQPESQSISTFYNNLYNMNYTSDCFVSYILSGINEVVTSLEILIIALFLFIIVFIFIIIHSYFSNSMDNRHKQLGVLKTLGLSNTQCGVIYLWETFMIVFIALLIAVPLNLILDYLIQFLISSSSRYPIVIFYFNPVNLLVVVLIIAGAGAVSTVTSLMRISKITINEVIRN